MDETMAPRVPGYTVGRLLGHGGSAVVWLGREQRTGREVALKCFRPAGESRRGSGGLSDEAVRREIRILSVLAHPHLVRAHHAVRFDSATGSGTALVLDYAPGGSLAQLVATRGRLGVGETVTVLTPIAQALAYLHGKGFRHSDVAPGNVLFTGQGKPLLSDVGIAQILGAPDRAGGSGTAGFLDPAPVDAVRAGLQPERDVYSLAAVGWYCLTGAAPAVTAERPPLSLLVPDVPKELAAALESGLNEDRRLRPTAAALAAAVYRSAPPRPVDLAESVHPTVIPELVTRRQVAASSGGSKIFPLAALKEKVDGWHRRMLTAQWPNGRTPVPRLPFPSTTAAPAARGKHTGTAAGPFPGRLRLRPFMPAALAMALAGAWWMAATVPAGPAAPEPGAAAGAAAGTVTAPGPAGAGPDATRAARQQATASDPAEAVTGLAALRDYAFTSGRLELLDEVNAEGSPAAALDARTAERLRSSGLVLAGFTSLLSDVVTEDVAAGEHAVVRATSATSAYQERDGAGSVLATGAASGGQPLRLVLVSVDGRWRISEIRPGT